MQKYKSSLVVIIIAFIWSASVFPQAYISDIYIDQRNVFDSTEGILFLSPKFLNSLHYDTRPYIIEDELLFEHDEEIEPQLLSETERNLRSTGLFSEVRIELDSVNHTTYDVYVVTRDRWSTQVSALIGTGGEEQEYGAKFEELNLLGTGTRVVLEGLYRTENNIQWQGLASLSKRRIFRSEYTLNAGLLSNKYRTQQGISLYKPYRTLSTELSYGASVNNSFGSDFLYVTDDSSRLMPFHERNYSGWFSKAWMREDRIFATGYLSFNDVNRIKLVYERAYDNSGVFLISFSSVARDYLVTSKLNDYKTDDLPIGGWGQAILGKIFPVGSKGENLYYLAGQGEQSYYNNGLYLFGQITGASSFKRARGVYTYEEFYGLGFYRLGEDWLLASRIRQQTVWNWGKLRQLILDNGTGLRGYELNRLAGDNRIIGNLELRFFPGYKIWIAKLSGLLFYDTGSVWFQDTHLTKTRWHNSVGIGIRFHNTKSRGDESALGIDLAYNFDNNSFGINLSSDQLFSVFANHSFRLPQVFGTEFDYE